MPEMHGMDRSQPAQSASPAAGAKLPAEQPKPETMDHSQMDHSQMDHSQMPGMGGMQGDGRCR